MILVDTSVLIDLLRGKIEAEKPEEHGNLAKCFLVQCELYRGTKIARNTEKGEKQVRKLVETMDELQADRESAEKIRRAQEKISLSKRVRPVDSRDLPQQRSLHTFLGRRLSRDR
jgi:predicted nucleic acid-binding protein